jgi:hypothetical protein
LFWGPKLEIAKQGQRDGISSASKSDSLKNGSVAVEIQAFFLKEGFVFGSSYVESLMFDN